MAEKKGALLVVLMADMKVAMRGMLVVDGSAAQKAAKMAVLLAAL
jgi:hypothetical protein